jgi:outer membrane protein insertion porin family
MTKSLKYLLLALSIVALNSTFAQPANQVDFLSPRKYRIGPIQVEGANFFDPNGIILISELREGEEITIPGDDISRSMKKLWDQGIFSEVEILQTRVDGITVHLLIRVKERPRLGSFNFVGVSKGEADKIKEEIDLYRNKILTENLKRNSAQIIRNHFIDKGFHNVSVRVEQGQDNTGNNLDSLVYYVDKGKKVKIAEIIIEGNTTLKPGKLYRSMKDTKRKLWYRVWKTSKFIRSSYKTDKEALIQKFKNTGLRDASIVRDSVYAINEKELGIKIWIEEGHKYYFGDISWSGNTKHSTGKLDTLLGIRKGDVFNQGLLESRLYMDPAGTDITSLYMNKGYLFFNITPVEVRVYNDTIDYEIRINEGKQAYVRSVIVKGNTKTSDHVIYREIRTKPGDLFNREDIIRTQRELANTGWFDPEKFQINPLPDPATGTVDIEYIVEERPSDQVELSGGWGGGRVVGTLGLSFNNFSVRKMFKKSAWTPLPSGDGQRLSIRAQSNGLFWQSYNFSFTEPWLGGRKPNALSLSAYHSVQSNGRKLSDPERQSLAITGVSVGLGRRNKFPDDYFTNYQELGYQHYTVKNYSNLFVIDSGNSNAYFYQFRLSRNSVDQPIYPRSGSNVTFSLKLTPPYSWFNNKDYTDLPDAERYKLIEYNKWKFTTSIFQPLSKDRKLVLNARAGFGFLHYYTKQVGPPPFERFVLGGSGLTGFNLYGHEIIALRGYDDNSVSPQQGDMLIAKYTLELRYPLSLNPSATIWLQAFAEGGNTWSGFRYFNPFQVKRSAGVGVRIFLPMFGLMGLDYGWGFDGLDADSNGGHNPGSGQFHFTIGMNLGEL